MAMNVKKKRWLSKSCRNWHHGNNCSNINKVNDLGPDEFAFEFLNQNHSQEHVNVLDYTKEKSKKCRSGKDGKKLSVMDAVLLAMLCLRSCFIGCGVSSVEAKNPMVCCFHHTDQPYLF